MANRPHADAARAPPYTPPATFVEASVAKGFLIDFFDKCGEESAPKKVMALLAGARIANGDGNIACRVEVPPAVDQIHPRVGEGKKRAANFVWYVHPSGVWCGTGHYWPAGCMLFVDEKTGEHAAADTFSHCVHDHQPDLEAGWNDALKFLQRRVKVQQ